MIYTNLATAMKVIPYVIEIYNKTKGRQLGTPKMAADNSQWH